MADFNLEQKFNQHKHNGVDSKSIRFSDIEINKQASVTAPSGGLTIDAQARASINQIITRLEDLGLIDAN